MERLRSDFPLSEMRHCFNCIPIIDSTPSHAGHELPDAHIPTTLLLYFSSACLSCFSTCFWSSRVGWKKKYLCMFKMDFTRTLKSIPVCAAKTASSFLSGTKRHSGLLGGRTSECKSSWTVKCLDVELPEDKTSLVSTFDELWSVCASDPLLMTGGEVGDMEGQALLAGGGRGGGGGGVDESCPSSSEELSSVRSMTSTFLLLPPPLLSLLAWLDEEEPCWSAPADVRHEPGEQHVSFMTWWCKKEKKNKKTERCWKPCAW